jgi:heme A synthase
MLFDDFLFRECRSRKRVASRLGRKREGYLEAILLILVFGLGFLTFKGGNYLFVGVASWLGFVFAWLYFSLYGVNLPKKRAK